jgi:hypothetical protein
MKTQLSPQDYILISAHLDGQLDSAQIRTFEKRLQASNDFKQAVDEIAYTRRLLRALPKVRAPRNFTLSAERVKKTGLNRRFQPVFGTLSAVATFLLIAVFAGTNLLPMLGMARSAAPAMAPAAENLMDTQKLTSESPAPLMIIQWNPPNTAYGIGGGPQEKDLSNASGMGGGGNPINPVPQPGQTTTSPSTLAPELTSRQADPSTLILGLPQPGTEGSALTREGTLVPQPVPQLSLQNTLMIGLAGFSLMFGVLAVLLRRR